MAQSKYVGVERRRFVRIPFWFVTKYRLYPYDVESPQEFRQGIGKNISAGGICFEAKDKFQKDDVLELEIDMPALEHAVRVIGKVVWTRQQEEAERFVYGLAFTKIAPEDVEAVKKIVETFA